MNTLTLTQGQLAEARDWLADCFATCPAGRLSAASVTSAVARYYEGGLPAFIAATPL